MNPRRLYRCRHDRQLAGVAAGMAEYLDLDPTLVRVLWIISAFFGGLTILLYVILAFVIPLEPAGETPGGVVDPGPRPDARRDGRGGLYLGVLLVVFGAIALANAVIPGWAGAAALGPAFIVAVGVALLVGSTRRGAPES